MVVADPSVAVSLDNLDREFWIMGAEDDLDTVVQELSQRVEGERESVLRVVARKWIVRVDCTKSLLSDGVAW